MRYEKDSLGVKRKDYLKLSDQLRGAKRQGGLSTMWNKDE
jgi:hypothetical protein